MKKLVNQTLWQCDFCGKRILTKRGAQIHELDYCSNYRSPHIIRVEKETREKQLKCSHVNVVTIPRYIPGEAVMEPDYEECADCGKRMH